MIAAALVATRPRTSMTIVVDSFPDWNQAQKARLSPRLPRDLDRFWKA